jgi:peptidyl-tRNA hydrolase, PTH2 family
MADVKQVIICRTDLKNKQGLKPRTGKLMAQVAHASLKAILDIGKFDNGTDHMLTLLLSKEAVQWVNGDYKKIVVGVDSEYELLLIYDEAVKQIPSIPKALIQDHGLTEFSSPTFTTVAIGPGNSEDIDKITKHLKLL